MQEETIYDLSGTTINRADCSNNIVRTIVEYNLNSGEIPTAELWQYEFQTDYPVYGCMMIDKIVVKVIGGGFYISGFYCEGKPVPYVECPRLVENIYIESIYRHLKSDIEKSKKQWGNMYGLGSIADIKLALVQRVLMSKSAFRSENTITIPLNIDIDRKVQTKDGETYISKLVSLTILKLDGIWMLSHVNGNYGEIVYFHGMEDNKLLKTLACCIDDPE